MWNLGRVCEKIKSLYLGTLLYKHKKLDTLHKALPFSMKTATTMLNYEDKYLLGLGMYDFLYKKLDTSGNYKKETYNVGYKDIQEFGRFMLVFWRFYANRWIFTSKTNEVIETVKVLSTTTYKHKVGETRAHEGNFDQILSSVRREVKKEEQNT